MLLWSVAQLRRGWLRMVVGVRVLDKEKSDGHEQEEDEGAQDG